jgi:hypothetical protein
MFRGKYTERLGNKLKEEISLIRIFAMY